jgi:hypothetical protein
VVEIAVAAADRHDRAAFVAHLPAAERARAARAALGATEEIDSPHGRAYALLELAAALPVEERGTPLARAYALAADSDGSQRKVLLQMLVPLVS